MNNHVPPMPPRVQIQTQSGCNGRCIFCPNGQIIEAGLEQGRMSEDLFRKIIGELAGRPPRRIGLYLMNEPLLDARLPSFVEYVSEHIPTAKSQIISNGTRLTPDVGEALIDAGLKQLKVSLQSLDNAVNERIMGYKSDRVVENCLAMQELIRRKKAKRLDFRVSMVVTSLNQDEIADARTFWQKNGVRLVTSALENRGGNIGNADTLNPHGMRTMGDCIRPSRDMMILFNGKVPLCCVDWFRHVILGDVAEQSVREVWNGPIANVVRECLRNGERERLPQICRDCSESAMPDYHRRGLKGILSRLFRTR